jgi:hypothetical protein
MIHLQKESIELDFWNLNYIKNTQTHIFEFEYFQIAQMTNILVPLDSTHFCESRDILFVIFGSMVQKIWIFKVWYIFWNF